MPRRSTLADQVRGNDRLPVTRGKRVGHAPEEGSAERCEDHERAQALAADQRGKAGVGDPVRRLKRLAGRESGWWAAGLVELPGHGSDVERALQQVLGVGAELVALALRLGAD